MNEKQNIIDDILNGKFYDLGKYRFIQGDINTHTIYVGDDDIWSEYVSLFNEMKLANNYEERDIVNIKFKHIREESSFKNVLLCPKKRLKLLKLMKMIFSGCIDY